jgi:NTE family protein
MTRALVVSGGGSKGAYAVGVAQVLMEEKGINFDVVCGTSTGGLIAPFVAARRLDVAREFYTTVYTKDILEFRNTSDLLKASSLATFTPLVRRAREAVAKIGIDGLLDAPTQMFMAATRLQDRNAVFFHNHSAPPVADLIFNQITDEDTLVRAMVATASVPGIAPPVEIGDFQYVDGGVREMTPLSVPVAMGVEEIYVILLSPQTSPLSDAWYWSIASVLGRTADSLTVDVARNDLNPIKRSEELAAFFSSAVARISTATTLPAAEVRSILADAGPQLELLARTRFVVIGPTEDLTKNSMEFNPKDMTRMMNQGIADARAALNAQ